MESEILKQREIQSRSLRDHVAGLKYKPHLSEIADPLRQQTLEEIEKIKEEKKRI